MDRDQNDHVAGRYNLRKLRICLHRLEVRSELHNVAPRLTEIVDHRVDEAPHYRALNIRQRTRLDTRLPLSAKDAVDVCKRNIRPHLNDDVSLERRQRNDADHRRVRHRLDKFLIGHLLNRKHLDVDHRPQTCRQIGVQETRKTLVQHEERANLIFRELIRSFEVIYLDFTLFFLRLDFLGGNRAVRKCRKQLVYFGLRQYVLSQDPSPFPLCSVSCCLLQQEAGDVNIVDGALTQTIVQRVFQLLLQFILL